MNPILPATPSSQPALEKNTETENSSERTFATTGGLAPHPSARSAPPIEERFTVNQLTAVRWALPEALAEFRQLGLNGIGIHWSKLLECGVRRGIRSIQESGLAVSSLGWIGGFTGEHGHTLPATLEEARRIIRVAGQLRASTVTVITGPQAGHIRTHAFRLVIEGLKELVQLARTYGVTLSLVPVHPLFQKNWSFVTSLDDALQILDRVDSPRLKLACSAYHLWEEPDLLDRIGKLAGQIGIVSLADWNQTPRHDNDRLLPGEGRLPLAQLIQVLEENGYSGWYEMEVWSRDLWKLEHRDLMRRCLAAQELLTGKTPAG